MINGPHTGSGPVRTRTVHSSDGAPLAVYDGEGRRSARVFYSHATGFCAGSWAAVAEECSLEWTAWDFRGHGGSGRVAPRLSWWEMGADAAAVRDSSPTTRAIGVGHSMGGAALVMAQLDDRTRFDALVLYEPILPVPPFRRDRQEPLAVRARKRRAEFASRQEALANYSSKPPFDRWDRRALEGYVGSGVTDRSGVAGLACLPDTEAEVFIASRAHAVLERLGEIEIPVVVVWGAETDTYPREVAEEIASGFVRGQVAIEPETGHFGPMERPVSLARLIEQTAAA